MCSYHADEAQRREAEKVDDLLASRAAKKIHPGYPVTAIGTSATAVLAWGMLLLYGLRDDVTTMTIRDGTIMTLFVVLAGVSVGSTAVLVSVRHQQRLAAEQDRIDNYREEKAARLMRELRDAVLNEGDQDTKTALHAVQSLIDGPGNGVPRLGGGRSR